MTTELRFRIEEFCNQRGLHDLSSEILFKEYLADIVEFVGDALEIPYVKELEKDIFNLTGEKEDLKDEVEVLQDENCALVDEIGTLKEDIKRLKNKVNLLEDTNRNLEDKLKWGIPQ